MMISALLTIFLAAAKLPLVEVPATRGASDTLVIFISGDGGWAKIDKSIASILASNGMPVVGLNSLQYFWTKRTPESASRDLQSIIDTYLARDQKSRLLLVGYSRGADVLPAMVARLPAETQAKIRLIALIAPSPRVELEFHVADWMRDSKRGIAVKPDLEKVKAKTLCIWGEDDHDSLCSGLSLPNVQVVTLRGSHHFEGDYAQLAKIILEGLK
jgi:type IV secretory pathway VirJ component